MNEQKQTKNDEEEEKKLQSIEDESALSRIHFDFKEPEFRSFVPIEARYECAQCHKLFGDKYRFRMHSLWAHQSVVCSKRAQNEQWKIVNHFECDKPLSFACPYAGCLRGYNDKKEIEAHILRHHDITDPTKPQSKKAKEKKEDEKQKEDEEAKDGYAQLTKIWNEANEHPIDRENQRDLVKHFVSSVMSDNLQKFDQTTKRLQRRYKKMSASSTQNTTKYEPNEMPPMLGDDEVLQQKETQNDGPRSMWN